METFLTFIFVTVLVLYLAGQLGKWLLRRWILRKQREFAEKFGEQAAGFGQAYTWSTGTRRQRQSATAEGEIRVQRTRREEKKARGQIGEYVDFEEVKE
ncbi:MAG: DUF4834 family protein [Alistipes sp.]|nr:DUF4834 family protein [Alistipes sp.]